jgi:hypothetical protein
MADVILTVEQLYELTRKRKSCAQCRALEALGIPYRKRPDGSPVVFTASMQQNPAPQQRGPVLRLETLKRDRRAS